MSIILASDTDIRGLIKEVREHRGFDLERGVDAVQVILLSADEKLYGPFDVANRDVRILLKTTTYGDEGAFDIQFVVIDCEGDILNHDAWGLDLNVNLIKVY